MKSVYHLFVNGIPKAQPRPRIAANGHVYNPKTAAVWKEEIKAAFLSCIKPTITEPVYLQVTFFLPAPKGMKIEKKGCLFVPHIKKPDTDNLLKALMDAITEIGVWKDDAQVYKNLTDKYYAPNKPGAQIIIETF